MKLLVASGVLFFAIVADCGVSMNNPFYCYMTDPIRPMTNMFTTETSYEATRRFNFATVNPYISTCTPSRFWYLGRDGGHFPESAILPNFLNFANSSIQADIERNYEAGRTTLCRKDFEAIRDWTKPANMTMGNASNISDAGILTMENIARRFQQSFPEVLAETYSVDRFLFRHTYSRRNNDSTRAFARAIFGEDGYQSVIYEDVPENDQFLRPFDFCPEFREHIESWQPSQRLAFRDGPEFEQMTAEINRKLGFFGSNRLSLQSIIVMWDWCIFETSSTFQFSNSETGPDSPWCSPFSVDHHLLLEYSQDLYSFYTSGHGVRNQRLMENLLCGLMQDLLTHVQSDDGPPARIFFSYFQEMLGMLVTFGTFRDTRPLHQHNFAQQSARHWFSSLMVPLAANLVVVRFDCDDGDHDLMFLLNEKPILVPGCDPQTGICKLSVFVNRFQRFADANCETLYCSSD